MPMKIPFHRVENDPRELAAMARVVRSGLTGGGGKVSRRVEERIRKWTGGARVLLTPSGSAALEMAFLLLDLRPGDEVILPAFAFVSDANGIIRAGGRPVFAEIDEDTLNISPEDVRRRLGRRTRAILPVHYGGIPCRMEALREIARKRKVAIVEDAAHSFGGTWRGRPLGGIGEMGVFSFHQTKNLSCGEGGALAIRSKRLARRGEIIQEKGTDRHRFLRGKVNRYVWKDIGSSYLLSDILSALLEVQIQKGEEFMAARRRWWEMYLEGLAPLAERGKITLPPPLEEARSACHLFHLRVRPARDRDRVLRSLHRAGVEATFHFVPLHTSPFGRKVLGGRPGDLPVTERAARSLVRLPLHPFLREGEVRTVIQAVKKAVG